jgi:hypothetical protein
LAPPQLCPEDQQSGLRKRSGHILGIAEAVPWATRSGIQLDAADGGGGAFYVDHPELEEGALVNMLWLGNNRVAFALAQRHLRQLDPDIWHPVMQERSLRFAGMQTMRPDPNDSVDPADIARLANYPVTINTKIDRMNVEVS